jgi:hypothetical protein
MRPLCVKPETLSKRHALIPTIRYPMQSPTTTSHVLACPLHPTHHLISPASLRLRPRSSSQTSRRTHISSLALDRQIPQAIIPWAVWALLADLQVPLRQEARRVGRIPEQRPKTTTLAFSVQGMGVVVKVAARGGQSSLWRTWAWLLASMASTSSGASSTGSECRLLHLGA